VQRLSALELAAQRGIGPLSPQGLKVWHGESYPCVSCGELVRRSAIVCDQCGQDLSLKMIVKMQAHAGPWYVHEHIRPFPGVTLERLIRQAQRGLLTATTIVRGPTTFHQWRYAAETPALSKHLGLCWNCQAKVTSDDTRCHACSVDLDRPAGEEAAQPPFSAAAPAGQAATPPRATTTPPVSAPPAARASEIERIRAALGSAHPQAPAPRRHRLPIGIIIAAILVVTIAALLVVVQLRQKTQTMPPQATPTPAPTVVPDLPGE
jgi:hypothetical protein